MKAYAIYAGGGVKGAALAGCLCAAEQQGVKFIGHGGTSAGSMIAVLAAVGYSGEELEKILVEELDFRDLLEDQGHRLARKHLMGNNCTRRCGEYNDELGEHRPPSFALRGIATWWYLAELSCLATSPLS